MTKEKVEDKFREQYLELSSKEAKELVEEADTEVLLKHLEKIRKYMNEEELTSEEREQLEGIQEIVVRHLNLLELSTSDELVKLSKKEVAWAKKSMSEKELERLQEMITIRKENASKSYGKNQARQEELSFRKEKIEERKEELRKEAVDLKESVERLGKIRSAL